MNLIEHINQNAELLAEIANYARKNSKFERLKIATNDDRNRIIELQSLHSSKREEGAGIITHPASIEASKLGRILALETEKTLKKINGVLMSVIQKDQIAKTKFSPVMMMLSKWNSSHFGPAERLALIDALLTPPKKKSGFFANMLGKK